MKLNALKELLYFYLLSCIHATDTHSNEDLLMPDLTKETKFSYNYLKEYNPNLEKIYTQYLKVGAYQNYYLQCGNYSSKELFISKDDMMDAELDADKRIKEWDLFNKQYLQRFSTPIDPITSGISRQSIYNQFFTQYLVENNCIDKYNGAIHLPSYAINKNQFCFSDSETDTLLTCDENAKYRSISGRCNNIKKNLWGSSYHCHRRLLPPDYANGINSFRVDIFGNNLPSARFLSNNLFPDVDVDDKKLASIHMQWGQLIAHDILRTMQTYGSSIRCCSPNNNDIHPECIAITFEPDSITREFDGQTCIHFVRTYSCNTCHLGPRNQLNLATSFLDLSQVYGINPLDAKSLRTLSGGKLLSNYDSNGKEILVGYSANFSNYDPDNIVRCNSQSWDKNDFCFMSGDGSRGSQSPSLNALMVLLHRRHNQHAESLAQVNPHWDDETLYQESRRILIAEYNTINFDEYLPVILGKTLMDYFDLGLTSYGHTLYNASVDPSSIHSFATSAFRFGHSQIQSLFNVFPRNKEPYSYLLRYRFNDMRDIWAGNTEGIIKGLLEESAMKTDNYFINDIKDYLYFNPTTNAGRDLVASDILRNRDHGIPAYVHYLQYCTGIHINSWEDLNKVMCSQKVEKLREYYKNWKDIDLFVGGIYEKPIYDSLLGPTFSCLIGIQFYHLKFGDRFYFEHKNEAGSFTNEQLNHIRQIASLANLICKTTDIESVQVKVMHSTHINNPPLPCELFPQFDYRLWQQTEKH